ARGRRQGTITNQLGTGNRKTGNWRTGWQVLTYLSTSADALTTDALPTDVRQFNPDSFLKPGSIRRPAC
ncbi:MAG: hypothetical protein ACK2UK_13140, partial [Candidatus Promineifilaceae bacterium]